MSGAECLVLELSVPLEGFVLEVEAALPAGVVWLLGESGAGKTSLLEAVAGLRAGTRGRIVLHGRELQTRAGLELPPEQRGIGYVPQDGLLFPHLTVEGNVRFQARGRDGHPTWEHWVAALELAPLLARRPRTLSGGERQRVALARALSTCPDALLLDEPLSGLDVERRQRFLRLLAGTLPSLPIPTLFATHHPLDAPPMARGSLTLVNGRSVLALLSSGGDGSETPRGG